MEIFIFCIKTMFFHLKSDIYQQEEVMAMGLPFLPVLTNLYMEYFDEMALEITPLKPKVWLRYVDYFIL